jgi:hypothetical protein
MVEQKEKFRQLGRSQVISQFRPARRQGQPSTPPPPRPPPKVQTPRMQGQHLSVARAFFDGGGGCRRHRRLMLLRRWRPEPRLRADARYWGRVQGYGGVGVPAKVPTMVTRISGCRFSMKIGANSIATCRTLIPTGMILILMPRVQYFNSLLKQPSDLHQHNKINGFISTQDHISSWKQMKAHMAASNFGPTGADDEVIAKVDAAIVSIPALTGYCPEPSSKERPSPPETSPPPEQRQRRMADDVPKLHEWYRAQRRGVPRQPPPQPPISLRQVWPTLQRQPRPSM